MPICCICGEKKDKIELNAEGVCLDCDNSILYSCIPLDIEDL